MEVRVLPCAPVYAKHSAMTLRRRSRAVVLSAWTFSRIKFEYILNISIFEVGAGDGLEFGKEQANRKKHGVDFRTAAKVFLDPYVIEFDDFDAANELRFNAIGLVDGRMLFVTYTMRGAVVVSYPREERSRMKKGSITKFRLSPKKPPKTDWRAFDAMSEEERHQAALSDPDFSASDRGAACAGSSHSDGPRLAPEAEADAGGVRCTLSSPARYCPRLGAGCASP